MKIKCKSPIRNKWRCHTPISKKAIYLTKGSSKKKPTSKINKEHD